LDDLGDPGTVLVPENLRRADLEKVANVFPRVRPSMARAFLIRAMISSGGSPSPLGAGFSIIYCNDQRAGVVTVTL
jgi:hypothetical protein